MRKIKFRAWDKIKKRMIDVIAFYRYFRDKGKIIVWGGRLRKYPKLPMSVSQFEVSEKEEKDCILMEYTGQKDKNKKEIWEGDIVKGEKGEIYEVVWDDEGGRFLFIFDKDNDKDNMEGYDLSISALVEVIGNKWENPELLEAEDGE